MEDELVGQVGWKGRVTAPAHVIHSHSNTLASDIDAMPHGAVLVTQQTLAHLAPASAIVTDEGGLLSHAATVSRERKIPSVLGTKTATKLLKSGDMVEVDAENGVVRKISE